MKSTVSRQCGLVLAGLFAAVVVRTAWSIEAPPAPWPGPSKAWVFVEGEDLHVEGQGWDVVEPGRDRYGERVASGLKVLSGAGAGEGTASADITVPESGEYVLHVRFSQWPGEEAAERMAPFRMRVMQGARTVLDKVMGDEPVGPDAKRAYAAVLRWGRSTVTLKKGPARIVLSKEPQTRILRTLRWVDCLLLTMDREYEPDYRDFNPQTYIRLHLEDAEPGWVYFYCFVNHTRAPWYRNVYFDKEGWRPSIKPRSLDTYLAPGDSTPWMNVSRLCNVASDTIFKIMATARYHNPDASRSSYSIEFATAPAGTDVIKTVVRSGPGAGIYVRVPYGMSAERLPIPDYEYAAERLAMISMMPPIDFGRRPQVFPVSVGIPGSILRNTPGTREAELRAAAYLGLDGTMAPLTRQDFESGLRFGRTSAGIWHMGEAGFNDPDLKKIEQRLQAAAQALKEGPYPQRVTHLSLMDEASARSLEHLASYPLNQAVFVDWLREHAPADFRPDEQGMLPNGVRAEIVAGRDGPAELYYFSQRFRAWTIAHFFSRVTAIARSYFPEAVRTTQNFSDGAVYMANMYMQGNDYYEWFENDALGCAHSEDWTNGGATHELCGWNVALLRSATRRHGQPVQMYCITSYGRAPLVVKLKAYTDIAEGAKALGFYAFSPLYAGHEHGWAERWEMYPAVAELTREIGAAEDVLLDAMPRRAETAIIYSIPYDIWNVGVDNTQGHERMFTYLALRHAQIPVDVVNGDDVAAGDLKGRRTAYLFGEQINESMVPSLAAWVRKGGTLVLSPGAGTRNRFNRPSEALNKALGLARRPMESLQKIQHSSRYVCELLEPKGDVHPAAGDKAGAAWELLACMEPLHVGTNAVVRARLADGQAVAAAVPVGEGRVDLCGFMPGLAYVRGAWLDYKEHMEDPVHPLACVAETMTAAYDEYRQMKPGAVTVPRNKHSQFPTAYRSNLREFIVYPARSSGASAPVQVDAPVVEATFMEGKLGWVVPLANYTGRAIALLEVSVRPGRPCENIVSARQGKLTTETTPDGVLRVRLPLESTDMLYALWKPGVVE